MMKFIAFTVALTVGGVLAQFGFCGLAAATSSDLSDAFSRLDALAEELAERQRELGGAPEAPFDPAPLPLPETPPPVDEALAPAPTRLPVDTQGKPVCGVRQDLAERMASLQQRYDAHGAVIIAVNDALPAFRAGVLDMEGICAPRLAENVDSALARIGVIDLEPDRQVVDTLITCVDRLREETDDKFNTTTNSIRAQRLANEMELLNAMTLGVTGLERALLRGISKRDRLVQELEQYRQEIQGACE